MIKGLLFDYGGVMLPVSNHDLLLEGAGKLPFQNDCLNSPTAYPQMIAFVNFLRSRDYQTGALSNVKPDVAARSRALGEYDVFDFAQLSCEVGVRKPEQQSFNLAMSSFKGLLANEILFLDDTPRNIYAANNFGMETYLVHDICQLITDVLLRLEITDI